MKLNREQEQITNSNNELYDYVKRIVAAVKYKGYDDHEDVPSILKEFANDYKWKIKQLTEENERLKAIPEQLHKEMSERMIQECKIERKLAKRKVEEIFEEIEKVLKRKISRANPHFEKLENRGEDNLSKWGCEDVGYFKGIISTCEDIQDVVADLKKKDIGE